MASLLILGGVIPLAAAIVAQYGFHLAPCHFCLLQRYPYGPVIACGVGSLLVYRTGLAWRFLVALGILGLLVTGTLGVIHTGIEQGWLHYTGGCVAQASSDHSLAGVLAAIKAAPIVACNEAAMHFLDLSMASWNAVWVVLVIIGIAFQYRYDRRTYSKSRVAA